jgi:hypothetical protein
MANPPGLSDLPHLRRQMPFRLGDDSENASSLNMRQPRQSLNLRFNWLIQENLLFQLRFQMRSI